MSVPLCQALIAADENWAGMGFQRRGATLKPAGIGSRAAGSAAGTTSALSTSMVKLHQRTVRKAWGLPVLAAGVLLLGCGATSLDSDAALEAASEDVSGGGLHATESPGAMTVSSGNAGPNCELSFAAPTLPAMQDVSVERAPEVCRCTRRPGAGNSFQCPQGAGISVSQEVGPAGGDVSLDGTPSTRGVPVTLRIPPNALSETVTIRITELSSPPPEEVADWSPLYHFEPDDLIFAAPVEVRLPWSSTSGSVARELSVYWSEASGSCSLAPLADNYVNAGFNQGSVRHLGWAIAGAPRAEASTCP